jgi:hypothetical protein
MFRRLPVLVFGLAALMAVPLWAGTIDTAFLEQPWPKQRTHETEVGRHAVTWREYASKGEGIFAGVRFNAPLGRGDVWALANEYEDIGSITPGVTAVRYLERTEWREVIEVDVKILWKSLTLKFEVEKEPPRIVRFRLVNEALGEYRGFSRFEENGAGQTAIDLVTWLKPNRSVPVRLLLVVERIAMLQASREFLKRCDERLKRAAGLRADMGPGSPAPEMLTPSSRVDTPPTLC